jgi:hypothetical protein
MMRLTRLRLVGPACLEDLIGGTGSKSPRLGISSYQWQSSRWTGYEVLTTVKQVARKIGSLTVLYTYLHIYAPRLAQVVKWPICPCAQTIFLGQTLTSKQAKAVQRRSPFPLHAQRNNSETCSYYPSATACMGSRLCSLFQSLDEPSGPWMIAAQRNFRLEALQSNVGKLMLCFVAPEWQSDKTPAPHFWPAIIIR